MIIKIRAWNKKEQRRATYEELLGDIKIAASVAAPSTLSVVDENYDVMLSTGLFDKNGEEIFGGDILENLYYKKEGEYNREVVEWEDNYGAYNISYSLVECTINTECWEVVGNKYEHQDLIK